MLLAKLSLDDQPRANVSFESLLVLEPKPELTQGFNVNQKAQVNCGQQKSSELSRLA